MGAGDGTDFSMTILTRGEKVFGSNFVDINQCHHIYDDKGDVVTVTLIPTIIIDRYLTNRGLVFYNMTKTDQ